MEYRILGPLEICCDGRSVKLGSGKQRALLALLLIHRNETVPIERLVEELWDGRPPETAQKIVQNYVSLLRRSLASEGAGERTLRTRGHAYLLHVEDGELDVDRFEALAAQGRRGLSDGEPSAAATALRDALAVWRGEPLADFNYEPFAQIEIARLAERRLLVLEDRIEANLACGQHAELIGELETLVAAHQLRERLQGQLMLALYRSGRQAEALDVYRRLRRLLVDELGIEPGPAVRELEQRILRQDPELELPAVPVDGRRPSRKRWSVPAAATLGIVLAAIALALVGRERSGDVAPSVVEPIERHSVVVIDPKTNLVSTTIPVGGEPGAIVIGIGSVWVANSAGETLTRIDAQTRRVIATIGLGIEPTSLAIDGYNVWVAGGRDRTLLRVDARDNRVRGRLRIREKVGPLALGYELGPSAVAAGARAVWLAHGEEVTRIDPVTMRVVATIKAGGSWSGAIAVTHGAVWVAENSAVAARRLPRGFTTGLSRIDPRSNTLVETIRVPGLKPSSSGLSLLSGAIAVGEGALWVAASAGERLWRIDVQSGDVIETMRAGNDPATVAVGEGAVWVENHGDETVVRVDPFSKDQPVTIPIGGPTRGIAVGEGAVWVTVP